MSALEPNTPAKRLAWIAKTYAKYPIVVWQMIDIIAHATGRDNWHLAVRDAARVDPEMLRAITEYGLVPTDRRARSDVPARYIQALVAMVSEFEQFNRRVPGEGIFPWMAAQLVAERQRPLEMQWGELGRDPQAIYARFKRQGAHYLAWMAAERPNIGGMSVEEVEAAVEEWEQAREEGEVKPGEVVYEFDDGWTVQELTTDEQLAYEGTAMQHCVGDYCEAVREGESRIFSVRDPRGRPHVTIEFDPNTSRVTQVMGKQNTDPIPEYQVRAEEFLASDVLPIDLIRLAIAEALDEAGCLYLNDENVANWMSDVWPEPVRAQAVGWINAGAEEPHQAMALWKVGITTENMNDWSPDARKQWDIIKDRPYLDYEIRKSSLDVAHLDASGRRR